ncbi:leucine-rich_repeat domain-containing protein [Hexamita inflata]|uniref:Leucine-rich repeat domain-containing protein n=1 Tax=Hexamita inflata TaxID=28002 RepID=A0AA86PQD9_9EUKA|nr:leucine-rich repeat domain-containing protein [Hexamita inflata]
MTEQNLNALNEEYDAKMTRKYEGKIKDGNLQIGDYSGGDPEITNLMFLEMFNIQSLILYISSDMCVKLRSSTLTKLTLIKQNNIFEIDQQQRLNLNINDLELENLEVLKLENNKLKNQQLYNLAKFKKLHTLNISLNNVDLTYIHNVTSLTKLSMRECGLTSIDQITSLVSLEELDLSGNIDIDLSPLCKLKSLNKFSILKCGLKNIDQIAQLTNLEVLAISFNQLLTIDSIRLLVNLKELNINSNNKIDITPLKDLVGLIKLDMNRCELRQLTALKSLINLQDLNLSFNFDINISELQYLKNLTHLNLMYCNIVSIYVLRPLVNLEVLHLSYNNIVHLDANLDEMKNLEKLRVQYNFVSDFSSVERHPNYNNINEDDDIYDQEEPSQEELLQANKFRNIERPNRQLKLIPHKSLKTTFNNFKQEINTTMNNARQSQIQFTANVVHLFQLLNQIGFE